MCLIPIFCQGPEDSFPLPIKQSKKGNTQIFKSALLAFIFYFLFLVLFLSELGMLVERAAIKNGIPDLRGSQ